MVTAAGIKYTKVSTGINYVNLNFDIYDKNQLLDDFLDLIEIKSWKNDETQS